MTAIANEARAKMAEARVGEDYDDLMKLLEAMDRELFLDLDRAVRCRVIEAEEKALRQQGEVIMAAIRGDLMAFPGCTPEWLNRPEGS